MAGRFTVEPILFFLRVIEIIAVCGQDDGNIHIFSQDAAPVIKSHQTHLNLHAAFLRQRDAKCAQAVSHLRSNLGRLPLSAVESVACRLIGIDTLLDTIGIQTLHKFLIRNRILTNDGLNHILLTIGDNIRQIRVYGIILFRA